jgi:hypothetical protein
VDRKVSGSEGARRSAKRAQRALVQSNKNREENDEQLA